jgi:hypothetical protein
MNIPETEQNRIDVSNLRFYARLFRENHWETDVMHWSVFSSTLDEVAERIAKAEQALAASQARIAELEKALEPVDASSDEYSCLDNDCFELGVQVAVNNLLTLRKRALSPKEPASGT